MRSLDLLVAGHINVDRFLRVRRFPRVDRTEPVRSQRVALGGTATNIARVAAGEGLTVGLVARIGDDFPRAFWSILRRERIRTEGIERVRGALSPVCFIVEDDRGQQRTLIDQGPMGDPREARPPDRSIGRASWVHLGTGDPDFQLRLARLATLRGRPVAADPGQEIHYRWDRRRLRTLVASAELLFGNHHEIDRATELLGARSVERLVELVPMVVRTEGAHGAQAFTRTGSVRVPSPRPRKVLSPVGAGDAFRGGFYGAWLRGAPLRAALLAGVRSAVRWIEEGPAGGPTRHGGRRREK